MIDIADNILVARGKYATVNSARKAKLELLRRNMESVVGYATRLLRSVDDTEFATEQMVAAQETLSNASVTLLECNDLKNQLDELRPEAWGERKEAA